MRWGDNMAFPCEFFAGSQFGIVLKICVALLMKAFMIFLFNNIFTSLNAGPSRSLILVRFASISVIKPSPVTKNSQRTTPSMPLLRADLG